MFSPSLFLFYSLPAVSCMGQYAVNCRKGYAAYMLGGNEEAPGYFEESHADSPHSGATQAWL